MISKDTILINEIPAGTPTEFLTPSGQLFLDLESDFTFQITENAAELNDVNELKGSGVLGFTVPMSPKNIWIFQDYLLPGTLEQGFSPIYVTSMGGGSRYMPQNLIFFKGSNDGDYSIEVELVEDGQFWLTRAQDLFLSELDLGEFTMNAANLQANWALDGIWEADGSNGEAWFPLCHYGGFSRRFDFDNGGVSVEDFLPWFSIPGILKKGFLECGWTFDSPLLTGEWFRRLWAYLIEEVVEYTGKGGHYEIVVENTSGMPVGGPNNANRLLWTQVNLDNEGGHFFQGPVNPFTTFSRFMNVTELNSDFRATLNLVVGNPLLSAISFEVRVVLFNENLELDRSARYQVPASSTESIEVKLEYNLDFGQEVYFQIVGYSGSSPAEIFSISPTSTCSVIPISNRIYRNDVVQLNELVRSEYTFIDFLKGVVHLGAFKIDQDFSTRTITIFPPQETSVYSDQVEGYLLDGSNDLNITDQVVPESRQIITPSGQNARFYRIQFKKSTDTFISEKLTQDNDFELYSQDLDLGNGNDRETKILENSFFEPTGDILWKGLTIPALWDNNEGNRSSDIEARVAYAVGYYAQITGSGADNRVGWVFEWDTIEKMPYLSQLPIQPFDELDNGVPVTPDKSVVYGGQPDGNESLFTQFCEFESDFLISTRVFEFLIFVNQTEFDQMDFRKRLFFFYGGFTYLVKLIEKKDFRTAQAIPMIIRVRPMPTNLTTTAGMGPIRLDPAPVFE